MLWKIFQTTVFLAVAFACIYVAENDPTFPKNGFMNALFAAGAAWAATALLSWLIDLPARIRASFQRRKQRRDSRRALRGELRQGGHDLIG